MLDATLQTQLKAYLDNLKRPIELIATLNGSDASGQMQEMLEGIEALSDKIALIKDGQSSRAPSFGVRQPGEAVRVEFAGIPTGHEFTSLVLALLHAGGHPPKTEEAILEQIRHLDGEFVFETYISLSCQNCPDVVQALNLMATFNPNVRHTMIDGALFQDEVDTRQIMAVPTVYLNGTSFGQGRMSLAEILNKVDTGAAKRQAAALSEKETYDMLIVGGGPAGAAAAVYSARKGIRTGIVAERFGGQVMDTLAIENFISVQETEGPKLAAALEEHVKSYNVDVIDVQTAKRLIPAVNGKPFRIELESGAELSAKSVVISTGARWRKIGVPGEDQYRNHGVAYCPHCDGPLFKGKHVAVIGGGNSGVEAAIDLAGIVGRVTLLEFGEHLRADAVLQRKLESLDNVTIITQAQTTEITGDGKKVNGLTYTDRASNESQHITLEGVFVQIGLVPNSAWLADTLELSKHGEIEVDTHGQTSVPGVFAAGDVTTAPYKQIIIAMGEGAKASLAAFDYLIRQDSDA